MGRHSKKCPKKCTSHLFSLKPVHYSAFFSRETQFNYCPQNSKSEHIIPRFNTDKKPYTAAFILAVDQLKLQSHDKFYQMEHERFKKQNHEQKTQILVPKPKTKSCYCNVCKEIYEDYQQHISSNRHKKILDSNQFAKDIERMCKLFGNNPFKASKALLPSELLSSLSLKYLNEASTGLEVSNQKNMYLQNEQPQLLLRKSTKDNFEGLTFCKSIKSFQNCQQKLQGQGLIGSQNNLIQYSFIKEMNQNCFVPHYGSFKPIQQTASPIKTKFDRPIVLTGKSFVLND